MDEVPLTTSESSETALEEVKEEEVPAAPAEKPAAATASPAPKEPPATEASEPPAKGADASVPPAKAARASEPQAPKAPKGEEKPVEKPKEEAKSSPSVVKEESKVLTKEEKPKVEAGELSPAQKPAEKKQVDTLPTAPPKVETPLKEEAKQPPADIHPPEPATTDKPKGTEGKVEELPAKSAEKLAAPESPAPAKHDLPRKEVVQKASDDPKAAESRSSVLYIALGLAGATAAGLFWYLSRARK